MSSFFDPREVGGGIAGTRYPEQREATKKLLEIALGKQPEAVLQEVRGLTDTEKAGISLIQNLVSGDGLSGVLSFFDKMMKGGDISKMPEFKAISDLVDQTTSKDLSKISRYMNMKGNLSTGKAGQTLLERVGLAGAQKTAALAPYAQEERNRQERAAGSLVQTLMQQAVLGSTPTVEGALAEQNLNAKYNYQNAQNFMTYQTMVPILQSIMSGPSASYVNPMQGPSEASQVAGFTSMGASLMGGPLGAGIWGLLNSSNSSNNGKWG